MLNLGVKIMHNQSKINPNLDLFHHMAMVNIRNDSIDLRPGILRQFTVSDVGNEISRAYLFQKDMFTIEQAQRWLNEQGIKYEWRKSTDV
jgi:hypothetical protein